MFILNFAFLVQKFSQTIKTLKSPMNFPLFDFDTGVYVTSNQRLKMCEKIQEAGNYLMDNEKLFLVLGIMALGIMSHWALWHWVL